MKKEAKSQLRRALALGISMLLMLGMVFLPIEVKAAETVTKDVTTETEFNEAMDLLETLQGDLIINIKNNITFTKANNSKIYSAYSGAGTFTINGNGYTLSGLTKPLVWGTWAGGSSKLTISDLTITNSNISGGTDGTHGAGAFVGNISATNKVTLSNCHLTNSKLNGADWTGGLIGYAAGYSGSDGPVRTTITLTGCSVTGNTIKGAGSTGGLMGHATGDTNTDIIIDSCEVSDNTIICTDSNVMKAGDIMGTVGIGTVLVKDSNSENNEVTSNGTEIERIYGRFGNNGSLTVNGGNYDMSDSNRPEESVGTLVIENGIFGCDLSDSDTLADGKITIQTGETTYVVTSKPTTITLDTTEKTIEEGQGFTITASLEPADSLAPITWSSSDETIATVDEEGNVQAIKEGTVTITATAVTSDVMLTAADTVQASCVVTVTKKAAGTITSPNPTVGDTDGKTNTTTVDVKPSNKIPKTGDTSNMGGNMICLMISAAVVSMIGFTKKENR